MGEADGTCRDAEDDEVDHPQDAAVHDARGNLVDAFEYPSETEPNRGVPSVPAVHYDAPCNVDVSVGSDAVQKVADDRGHENSVAPSVHDVLKGPGEAIVLPKTMREDFEEQKEVLELVSIEEQEVFWPGPQFGSSRLHLRPSLQIPFLSCPSFFAVCQ